MVTQKEVAKYAGVAVGTVSRVFNDDPRISMETRQRVLQVARRLGYIHPKAKNGSKSLTVVMGQLHNTEDEQFFARAVLGISDVCRQFSYSTNVVTFRFGDVEEQREEFLKLIQTQASAGFILPMLGYVTQRDLEPFMVNHKPLVLINRYLDDEEVDCVVVDDLWGGRHAAEILLEKGHRRIGYIGGVTNSTAMRDRYWGFRNVLSVAGCYQEEHFFFHKRLTFDAGYTTMSEILARKLGITAIFCANDNSALGAIQAIAEQGLRVGKDISVIGYNALNMDFTGGFRLCTFDYRLYDLGVCAARLLIQKIEEPSNIAQKIQIRPRYVEGNTVGPLVEC